MAAPTTVPSSAETATDHPSESFWAELDSFAVSVVLAHPEPGFTYTYRAPWESTLPLNSPMGAPTATVFPLIATEKPNSSSVVRSAGVSFAASCSEAHPVGGFRNTYAAPGNELAVWSAVEAPVTTVSPEIATALPRLSPEAPLEAVSFA